MSNFYEVRDYSLKFKTTPEETVDFLNKSENELISSHRNDWDDEGMQIQTDDIAYFLSGVFNENITVNADGEIKLSDDDYEHYESLFDGLEVLSPIITGTIDRMYCGLVGEAEQVEYGEDEPVYTSLSLQPVLVNNDEKATVNRYLLTISYAGDITLEFYKTYNEAYEAMINDFKDVANYDDEDVKAILADDNASENYDADISERGAWANDAGSEKTQCNWEIHDLKEYEKE